ncbi:MAG: shikimate kinase [Deltaproteobacteria bacterium]|nr:shikimate kinase [Deltaproteobacteria bacterium]
MDSNIILIGFMGAGKSTVGRMLAEYLRWDFVDLDSLIEASAGCAIREIFAREGEAFFRDLETAQLRKMALFRKTVVATGGGAVIRAENRILLKQTGTVVYLRAQLETLQQRVAQSTDRPLAQNPEHFAALLEERRRFYEEADIIVDTDACRVPEIVQRIAGMIEIDG